MHLPALTDIAKIRRQLGLTQTELARKAKVSQSLIARVEAGTVDPRYTKIAKLFEALDSLRKKEDTASQIMTPKCIGIEVGKSMEYAAKKMKKYNVSQMPIFEGNVIVGAISEKTVLDQIAKGKDVKKLSAEPVHYYMEDAFPTVNPETPLSLISTLLEHNSAVIVLDKGKCKGVITKADLLKFVHA